ncbi:hypothetical protein JCM16161A_01340 [Vulcanisaeta sp. JCM 16161]|uniref:DUF3311 domain-containing protein n=1 Tax=Vulcanisaeta sp. JCM 16161 TaxID=1295372 RepID=UPI000AF80574|nr:DUF3311 domain-containing protein [Vulcanisaeta sp. JCM 16161]
MTAEVSKRVAAWRKVVAGILFIIPWILYMLLPIYNTVQPELGGVPFFYWFQTLWLVISSILFIIAVLLLYPSKR